MPGPYFQRRSWPAFVYQGVTYSLRHLDEYTFRVVDTGRVERQIAVTFGDHCFTRTPAPGDDPALRYPDSDRNPGYFCFDRYTLSRDLITHIGSAAAGKVWTMQHDSLAIIPTVEHLGKPTYYGIIFSLDPVKGLPVDLHMRVKTAFPYTLDRPVTYGHTRFKHLVALRMSRKMPGRITGQQGKWPEPF